MKLQKQSTEPGVKLSDIDKCQEKIISDEGYGKYFTHRLGTVLVEMFMNMEMSLR